jgi:abhydrolase domain-containing protein 1/3
MTPLLHVLRPFLRTILFIFREENWGFLTEFDDKGREKEAKTVQEEEISVFTDELPNTNAGNYGYRTKKNIGEQIQNLEFKFYSDKRRRKMGDDLICY